MELQRELLEKIAKAVKTVTETDMVERIDLKTDNTKIYKCGKVLRIDIKIND